MRMLRAGLAVAALLIGGMAVLVGAVVMISALREGRIELSYGEGTDAVREVVARDGATATRFWTLFASLGGLPVVVGLIAMRWGWRTINN